MNLFAPLVAAFFWPARTEVSDNLVVDLPEDFFFGLATAPAQAEDHLKDQWLDFARAGHVHAWKNVPRPGDRSLFWTDPKAEIDLVLKAKVQVFRMGVDWARLYPAPRQFNETAMERYVEIVKMVKASGLKLMLTLFHHSIPGWTNDFGGWTSKDIFPHFSAFSMNVVAYLGDMIDYWVTFNEPHAFVTFTYCTGMWPPGFNVSVPAELACLLPGGKFNAALSNIGQAHNTFAQYLKTTNSSAKLGIAHNIGYYVPNSPQDLPAVKIIDAQTKFSFPDLVQDHLDFMGLNYYSREIISGAAPVITLDWEYSESGRCVDPEGLYILLKQFWKRYSGNVESIIMTENGIADATDILRPSYIAEHLIAIQQAIKEGVKVAGYVHWTTSDNWEWADGYCPKFGLAAVNRTAPGMPRVPRPSLQHYADIAETRKISQQQRDQYWKLVADAQSKNATRPFCRSSDGIDGLDEPVQRPFSQRDWRFKAVHEDAASLFV